MAIWRFGSAALAITLAIGGCAAPAPPPPPAAPVVSYDGTYAGTLKVTGTGAGVPIGGCAVDPRMVLQVRSNAFTYTQPHANAYGAGAAAEIAQSTPSYSATIGPGGSFSGQSQIGGTMSGVVSGTHMTGTIEGLVCVYSFTADRS